MKLDSVFALRDEVLENHYNQMKLADEPGIRAAAAPIPAYPAQRLAIGARYVSQGNYAVAIRLESRSGRAMSLARKLMEKVGNAHEIDFATVKPTVPSVMQLTATAGTAAPIPGASHCRPIEIGTSISHINGPPGTLGLFARVKDTGQIAALSNNHVIALSNAGQIGEKIFQPAIPDFRGPNAGNGVGELGSYRMLQIRGSNMFDAAYCILSDNQELAGDGNVIPLRYGSPEAGQHLKAPISIDELDDLVQAIGGAATVAKNGRKTGYTSANITSVAVGINDVVVSVPNLGNCRFDNLIEIESSDMQRPFSDLGDSGSICYLEKERTPFGLVFAAGTTERSDSKRYVTYACALPQIFEDYGLEALIT